MLAQRPGARVDDFFALRLDYGLLQVELGASSLIAAPRPRFALHGTDGSWTSEGIDPQEAQLVGGLLPNDAAYGWRELRAVGRITGATGLEQPGPTVRGEWPTFWRELAQAIRHGTPPPVTASDALEGLALIERAREAARQGAVLPL